MKKIIFCLMATFLSLTILPVQTFASTKEAPSVVAVTKDIKTEEAKTLTLRLNEIRSMDMSKLTSAEKKDLSKEARTIKRELKDISGGVYISAGALIVILILLVILT